MEEIAYADLGAAASGGKRGSASQQVLISLRRRILSLELPPGTALSRAGIAEEYGVSQTPVRDAMMKLEEEGLLSVFPQSKTVVSKIDVGHARETQVLRLSIELEVARRLTLAEDRAERLKTARRVLDAQAESLRRDDGLNRFGSLDRLFHQSLCEAAGVPNLWPVVTARSGHIDRLRELNLPDPGKPANIMHYHEAIHAALTDGDPQRAERMVREHLSGTLSSVDQIMARYPDFF